jgi:hypothetical protein
MRTFWTTSLLTGAVALLLFVPSAATRAASAPDNLAPSAPSLASTSASRDAAYADAQTRDDGRLANRVFADLASRYRYLDHVTVVMGDTPRGEQAVAYYTESRIVISRRHYVKIDKILQHEMWHIVDWRDNGRIDWHEDVPPLDAAKYVKH